MEKCFICQKPFSPFHFYDEEKTKPISPGYATDRHGHKICASCCGKLDARTLRKTGKLVGYLSFKRGPHFMAQKTGIIYGEGAFTNWPGTFSIPINAIKVSFNNFGASRRDFWFTFEDHPYHGVNVGNTSEIAIVKRTKK